MDTGVYLDYMVGCKGAMESYTMVEINNAPKKYAIRKFEQGDSFIAVQLKILSYLMLAQESSQLLNINRTTEKR